MPDPITHYYPPRTDQRNPALPAPDGFTRDPAAVTCAVCREHLAAAPHAPQEA